MFSLHLLALKRLIERPVVVLLSVLGVAAGVALAVSVSALLASVRQSIDNLVVLDEGASLTVSARSPLGFPEPLAELAAEDADVVEVSPQVRFPAIVDGREVIVIGRHDVDDPMAGPALIEPVGSDSSADAARRELSVATLDGPVVVSARRAPTELAAINAGRLLVLPLTQAQQISGRPGMIDAAPMVVKPGSEAVVVERLEARLGPEIHVAPADALQTYALGQLEQVQQPVVLMAGIALVAGAALVFNTIQTSARQRTREIAVLRALGGTKMQVSTSLLLEAVALGLVGSIVGLALGLRLARFIVGVLPAVVSTASGTLVSYHVSPSVVGLAFAAGLGTSVLAAFVPIRRIGRASSNQVLQRRPPTVEAPSPKGVAIIVAIGSAVTVGGLAMALSTSLSIAQNGIAVFLAGFLILGHGLARPLAGLAGALASRTGYLGALAQADSPDAARRVWAVAAAVFTAVTMAITVGASARNQVDTTVGQLDLTQATDVWVSSAASDDLPIGFHYPAEVGQRLAELPGVEGVTTESISYAIGVDRRYVLMGVDGRASYPVFGLAGPEVMDRVAVGDGAVITVQYAKEFGVDLGDTVEIDGVDGPVGLEVLAVTRTISVSNFGTVTIGRDHYVDALGDPGATGFQVFADPTLADDERDELARLVEATTRDLTRGAAPVVVGTGEEWFDAAVTVYRDIANIFLVLVGAIVAISGIATLNATASSVIERQRQLGVLRALGATGGQLRRIVVIETASAGAVGAVFGLLIGSFGHWVGVRVTNHATPFPTDYAFNLPTVAQALGAAAIAVALGAIIPPAISPG